MTGPIVCSECGNDIFNHARGCSGVTGKDAKIKLVHWVETKQPGQPAICGLEMVVHPDNKTKWTQDWAAVTCPECQAREDKGDWKPEDAGGYSGPRKWLYELMGHGTTGVCPRCGEFMEVKFHGTEPQLMDCLRCKLTNIPEREPFIPREPKAAVCHWVEDFDSPEARTGPAVCGARREFNPERGMPRVAKHIVNCPECLAWLARPPLEEMRANERTLLDRAERLRLYPNSGNGVDAREFAAAYVKAFNLGADQRDQNARRAERAHQEIRHRVALQNGLREAIDLVEGLADQQAMPDDWFKGPLARLRALAGGPAPAREAAEGTGLSVKEIDGILFVMVYGGYLARHSVEALEKLMKDRQPWVRMVVLEADLGTQIIAGAV